MKEGKKVKCYKWLIYKQFVQVSGLCGPQFLSYLPKRFTHWALYGDGVLVYRFGALIWPPGNQQKHPEFTFSLKALSFFCTRELAYVHINISSNNWNGYTAKNQEERLFKTRQHSYFGVTHCKTSEVHWIAVFSIWNMLRDWEHLFFISNLV